ncbi:MAG: NADH-quinone oxidoreductase subunit NuoE family protein [Planctomycetota bacterium]|jgi:NADH-quinone oxidoreductase subunit E
MTDTLQAVTRITEKRGRDRSSLISVLQDVHAAYNYLPEDSLEIVSRQLDLPLSAVYGVATFFKAFSFTPRGRHVTSVCLGTACHVRGGAPVAAEFERRLGIRTGDTSIDGEFTLETVNCLGCCAIGPVVVMDGKYRGHVQIRDVGSLIEESGGRLR